MNLVLWWVKSYNLQAPENRLDCKQVVVMRQQKAGVSAACWSKIVTKAHGYSPRHKHTNRHPQQSSTKHRQRQTVTDRHCVFISILFVTWWMSAAHVSLASSLCRRCHFFDKWSIKKEEDQFDCTEEQNVLFFINCNGGCQRLEYSSSLMAGTGRRRRHSDMSSVAGLSAFTPSMSTSWVMGSRFYVAHNGGQGWRVGFRGRGAARD